MIFLDNISNSSTQEKMEAYIQSLSPYKPFMVMNLLMKRSTNKLQSKVVLGLDEAANSQQTVVAESVHGPVCRERVD